MSQKRNTVNFVIHDANGKPQMVKVIQNTPNHIAPVKQSNIKIVKLPATSGSVDAVQGGSSGVQVLQSVKIGGVKCASKVVPLPADTLAQLKKEPESEQVQLNQFQVQQTLLQLKQEAREDPEFEELIIEVPPLQPKPSRERKGLRVMSYTSRRRHNSDNDPPPEYTTKRRKHADKVGKGLRHFSMKVCEKVRTKGSTSYNEVADELVAEFAAGMHGSADSQQYDQKNIRRRVYDALNVLMAMNIISKEKKEIRWLGLPTNSIQECTTLEKGKQLVIDRIQKKNEQLRELILQHISFKSLIERNRDAENKGVKPSPSSAIHLPFIVVNTSDKALIDCSISNDKTEYMFNFNKRFIIHDDIDILKRMGLLFGLDKGECTEENVERAKSMVPKSLEHFVEQMARGITPSLEDIYQEGEDEDEDELGDDEEEVEVAGEDEQEEVEGEVEAQEYSDDSSDVDV